jgi:hypothetical protein
MATFCIASLLFLCLASASAAITAGPCGVPDLLPWPRALQVLKGPRVGSLRELEMVLSADPTLGPFADSFQREANAQLATKPSTDAAKKPGSSLRVSMELRELDPVAPVDAHGPISGPEAYRLEMRTSASGAVLTISAEAVAGLFYGSRTALQLLRSHDLPQLTVIDAPVSSYRGVMIDNVRAHHEYEFHSEMLDRLAANKLNIYHLHASDDQGYTLPSHAFPGLSAKSGLNDTEVANLQTKATALQITIVAEVDLPGHSTALLRHIPALAAVDGTTGKPCASINVTSADALAILQTLLSEVPRLQRKPADG